MKTSKHLENIFLLLTIFSATRAFTEVTNTRGPIRTRTGCTIVLTCGGNGTNILWSLFGAGTQDPLTTKENQIVTSMEYSHPNSTYSYFVSNVTLTVTPAIDSERYTCYIFLNNRRTNTHTISVYVDTEPASIEPDISTVDISTYHENTKVSVGCPIQTCAESIQVQFLKGDQAVGTGTKERVVDMSTVYSLSLDVTPDIVGLYVCKVDTTNPNYSTSMVFNVTGTPLPPTPPPTDSTTTDSTTTDSTTTDSTTNANTMPTKPTDPNNNNNGGGDSSSAAMVTLPLLLTLVILSLAFSL